MPTEEEVLVLCAVFLLRMRSIKKNKREWSKKWLLRRPQYGCTETLYKEIAAEDFFAHNNFLRMTTQEFGEILQIMEPHLTRAITPMREPVSAKARLLITLRYLATGETQASLRFLFRVAQNTISKIISETTYWLYENMKGQYLKFPKSKEEWTAIAQEFYDEWNFVCLGAIDGKHCDIYAPPESGSLYFNYKQRNSIVLLAICDAQYRFLYASVGANGRVSDGGIWSRSELGIALEAGEIELPDPVLLPRSNIESSFFFVGDDAFPLKNYLMKPFPGNDLSSEQGYFNKRVSRARMCIECTFGQLSNRFEVLKKPMNVSPKQAIANIRATIVLHNFLRTKLISGKSARNNYQQVKHENQPEMGKPWKDLPAINDREPNTISRVLRQNLMYYYNHIDYISLGNS